MRKPGGKAFVISCLFWLIPGLAAGFLSAIFFSIHEYEFTVRLAESALDGESLPAGLKAAREEKEDAGEGGGQYLASYGYRRLGNLAENLPYTEGVCVVLFEAAGAVWFLIRRKEDKYRERRIQELTEYLKSAGRGEAMVLARKEDLFSHLEDEIYKTVLELACTKGEAVKDHEILSERIADIAHQLKTPLTSMSLMTELFEPSRKEEEEYLFRLKRQVERLRGLVSGLLALAKLDSHVLEFQQETVEIEELLEAAAEPLRELIEQKHIKVAVSHTEKQEVWIHADMQWTAEAFLNVMKNCLEHTPENGRLCISYEKNPLYAQVVLEDGGPGFAKKDLPHVFERFYRGEKAEKDSAGIGLALAKSIIEAQNGQIHAENSAAGHARFCIRWYRL